MVGIAVAMANTQTTRAAVVLSASPDSFVPRARFANAYRIMV